MATLLDDLVAFWPLNESSGNALDAHTNSITLTETSGTIASADGGRDFEAGDTEYFAAADSTLLSAPSTNLTVDCWVKFESLPASQMDIVSKYETASPADNREYRLWWNNTTNRLAFDVSTAGTSLSRGEVFANNFGNVSTGVWMHVTGWYDKDRSCVFIQVNGGEPDCGFVFSNSTIFDGAGPFHIGALGRATPTNYFDGIVKAVGLWKRCLTPDERTFLYNSGSGPRSYGDLNTTPTFTAQSGMLATNMIWTWFTTPVADYYNGKAWIGGFENTSANLARIAEYTIADGTAVVTDMATDLALTDDHNNPAVKRLASGKILSCYQAHPSTAYSQTSTNADDATAFGSAVTGRSNVSYAQIAQTTYNNRIYRFQRTSLSDQLFDYSDNDGATWTNGPAALLTNSGQRPYNRYWNTSGTRIDCVCTTGHPDETTNSLYHYYIDINASTGARNYYKSDGTLIGDDSTLPLEISDLTQVYNGSTNECWVWDCRYVNGQITCIFAVFVGGSSVHEYHRGRWNGSSWSTEKICDAGTTATADYLYSGQPYYSGGACLDPLDEDVVYVSREFAATDFRIHRFEKSGSWAASTFLSQGYGGINARPVAINVDGTTHVFWWSGRYVTYSNYQTAVYAHPAPQEESTPTAPSNSVAPVVTGTEATGKTLSCTTGTWSGADSYAYQWYSNSAASTSGGTAIGGATSSTYVVADSLDGLYIYCVVTATNGEGSTAEPSNVVGPILGLTVVVKANPTFADVADFQGQTLINEAVGDAGAGEEMPAPSTWETDSPVGDVDWSAFTLAVDANAINRSNRAGATLISPSYVVLAQHAPGDNTGHTWMRPDGTEITRTLGETLDVDYWEFSGSDLALAKLSAPINDITPMPMILDSSKIAGRGCLVLEMDRHLNAYVVPSDLTNADISVDVYQDPGTDYIESGDSGKPVTIIIDDTAVMVMTAMFASSIDGSRYIGLGPNASYFIDELFAIMAEDGESPTVWDLVISSGGREPSSASEFASAISCTNFPYYL